jgi:hypothetical protein
MAKAATPKQYVPDVSSQQQVVNALTKLERKLRWIGMEDEAREIRRQLRRPSDAHRPRPDGP